MTEPPQVLLVDGMGMLVRAAKAASRIKPLSHQGTPTGTLVMFAGSLVKHLRLRPWDYVVICWEGVAELNWRLEIYPEYKSSRPGRSGDVPELSQDEELAREFCAAAGLHQDWAVCFEGDDVIAAWWRAFRQAVPAATITILTADRDLLQLCDDHTACRAWTGDTTAEDVKEIWGVDPARLPLLRALAGDVSDGIPGVPGIGPQRAAKLTTDWMPPADIIACLHLTADQQAEVLAWYQISELRDPVNRPELSFGDLGERARWRPEARGWHVREFLNRFGMKRMIARMDAGELPWPPVPE